MRTIEPSQRGADDSSLFLNVPPAARPLAPLFPLSLAVFPTSGRSLATMFRPDFRLLMCPHSRSISPSRGDEEGEEDEEGDEEEDEEDEEGDEEDEEGDEDEDEEGGEARTTSVCPTATVDGLVIPAAHITRFW